MKKIITIIISITSVFAFNSLVFAGDYNDGMDFDPDLVDPMPGDYHPKSCNKVYAPICANKNNKKITYSNECEASKDYAKVLYKGKCKEDAQDHKILGPPVHVKTKGLNIVIPIGKSSNSSKDNTKKVGVNDKGLVMEDIPEVMTVNNFDNISANLDKENKKIKFSGKLANNIEDLSLPFDSNFSLIKKDGKIEVNLPEKIELGSGKEISLKAGFGDSGVVEIKANKHSVEFKDGDFKVKVNGMVEINLQSGGITFDKKKIKFSPSNVIKKIRKEIGQQEIILFDNNISLEKDGDNPIYKIKGKRLTSFFGLFDVEVNIDSIVNAETGEIEIDTPWWSFLTF